MKKRLSKQNAAEAAAPENLSKTDPAPSTQQPTASENSSKTDSAPSTQQPTASETPLKTETAPSTQQPTEASADPESIVGADGKILLNDVEQLHPDSQKLVNKMLVEGSTFEDVVEAFRERKGPGITLLAVKSYFQRKRNIQGKRARYMVKSGDNLLKYLGKSPRSAEARLAKAAFMTGYLKVHSEGSVVTPKEAERVNMVRENISLKRRLLIVEKQKAMQALKFSEAKTRLIVLSQERLKEQILILQQEAKTRLPGEPMGPEMLLRIQQLYGLACQPLLCEENANDAAKA